MFKSRIMLAMALTALLAMGFALVGCGGSSGGSSLGGGGVGKSPIFNATVEARNLDGTWTAVGATGTSGAITFTSAIEGYTSSQYPLVLRATGGTLNGGNGASFAGELRGVLETPGGTVYITPASTMVAALFDAGKTLASAQNEVRAIVQNALGYTNVDPLGNFLASTTATRQNEMAQQALLFVLLGTADVETNATTMGNLLAVLEATANDLATGAKDFDQIAQDNSGYNTSDYASVAAYIAANETQINQAAADALGVASSALPTITIDTTAKPEKFVINLFSAQPGADTNAVTVAADNNSAFVAPYNASAATVVYIGVGLTSTTGTWATLTDSNFSFSAISSDLNLYKGNATTDPAVTTSTVFTPATGVSATGIGDAPVITVQIPAATAVGTYTLTVTAASTTGVSVTRSVTIEVVDATSVVKASDFAWNGIVTNNLLQFTDTTTTNTLTDAATRSLAATEIAASTDILSGATKNSTQVNAQYRVGFVAPAGFGFLVPGDSTEYANYDLATMTQGVGSDWNANVPSTVSLVTTAAKQFGPYIFKANLINKDNDAVERTASKTLYAIDSNFASSIAKVEGLQYRNSGTPTTSVTFTQNSSSNPYVQFADTSAIFSGRVVTWTELASGNAAIASEPSGSWYLISTGTDGTDGLNSTGPTSFSTNVDVTSSMVWHAGTGSARIDVTNWYFKANTATNQDSVTLQFIGDSTYTTNVQSSGGVTVNTTP